MNAAEAIKLPLGVVLRHDAAFLMKLYDHVFPGMWGRGWETPDETTLMRYEKQMLWTVVDKKIDRKKLDAFASPVVLRLLSVYKDGTIVTGWAKDFEYLWRVEI